MSGFDNSTTHYRRWLCCFRIHKTVKSMVCAGMQFKDDEVPEWYCCGDIVCPFADEQLEDDEVHIAVDNTYLVIGWVAFNCVGSFFALPHNGSKKTWTVPPKDKNKVRLL